MSISVVLPIGPYKGNVEWLGEAVESINKQTMLPEQVVCILDGCDLMEPIDRLFDYGIGLRFRTWRPPWRVGVGHAFNFGVALAPTECVFMMGSDDVLHHECLERCWNRYISTGRVDGYYWVPVQYMSDGHVQHEVCNAAMVTKRFWRMTGGFPIEATTAPDAALNSIMMIHPELPRFKVGDGPLYYYRNHDDTDTRKHGEWWQTVIDIRNHVTREWGAPSWTRHFPMDGR